MEADSTCANGVRAGMEQEKCYLLAQSAMVHGLQVGLEPPGPCRAEFVSP